MMMTSGDLETLLRGDKIDVKALMRVCAEEHAQRETLSKTRQMWQRSAVRAKLLIGEREGQVASGEAGAQKKS